MCYSSISELLFIVFQKCFQKIDVPSFFLDVEEEEEEEEEDDDDGDEDDGEDVLDASQVGHPHLMNNILGLLKVCADCFNW